jgi:hypothetical protein
VYLEYLLLGCLVIGTEVLALSLNLSYRNIPRDNRIQVAESRPLVLQLKVGTVGETNAIRSREINVDNLTCTLYSR